MVADRLLTEVEQSGNCLARHSGGKQAQDFRFALAEVLEHATQSGQPVGRTARAPIMPIRVNPRVMDEGACGNPSRPAFESASAVTSP